MENIIYFDAFQLKESKDQFAISQIG